MSFELDVLDVEELLQQCARNGTGISYSEALLSLGHKFSRPKMRVLCRVLADVDERAAGRGEPELAVLVVRSGDRLPGDGWWQGRKHYRGDPEGQGAAKYVKRVQSKAFKYWKQAKG